MSTQVERMARMEVEVQTLKASLDEHKKYTKEEFSSINEKLDNLLALKYKGAGVFWLASMIFGTGIVGSFLAFGKYLFGRL